MPKIVNKRLIVFLAVAFMLGIFVGALVFHNLILTVIIPLVILLCGIIFYVFSKKLMVLVLFIAFAVGAVSYVIDYNINVKEISSNSVVSGRVSEIVADKIVLSKISIDGKKFRGKILVKGDAVDIGQNLTYYGSIETIDFDIFDTYSMNYYNDDIFYESKIIYVKEIKQDKLNVFESIKERTTTILNRYMEQEDTGIVKSLLFGDKSTLKYEDSVLIRSAGVSHIFAVSGLHVGFLIALLIFILKKMRVKPTFQLLIIGIIIFLYGFLCGFPAGLKRAGIMALVYLLSNLTCNKNDNLTTLSLSVLIILLMNPVEMFDLGFIMSVSAVFGIILFYKPIYSFLSFKCKNKAYLFLVGSIALTLSANVFLLPISCNIFQTLSVYMLLGNLVIVPLVTFAYSSLILVAFLSLIYQGFGILYVGLRYPVIAIRAVCKLISMLPMATLALPSMGIFTFTYITSFLIMSRFIMVKRTTKFITIIGLVGISVLTFLLI